MKTASILPAQISIFSRRCSHDHRGKADAIFMGGSGGHLTDLIDWSMRNCIPQGVW
jgi:cobalt-precorrin-6B (C15)-methyltransferase